MNNIRAASVQFQHLPNDKTANPEKIRAFVANAAAQQVAQAPRTVPIRQQYLDPPHSKYAVIRN